MAEYIKREAAIKSAKHAWAKGLEPSQYIEIIPAADVAPVRHGRWIEAKEIGDCCYRCSNCQFMRDAYLLDVENYCPNCGEKMDLDG